MLPRRHFKTTQVDKSLNGEVTGTINTVNKQEKSLNIINNLNENYNITFNSTEVGTIIDFESIFNTNKG